MDLSPAYVASDAHLGATSPSRAEAFCEWLAWAGGRASSIVINGDLFDFWFEYASVIPRGYTRTLGMLARVVDAGVPVHFLGGNHDWWGGSYLTDEIGVQFHAEPVRLELAGHRCLIAHGDGLGSGDLRYRFLRGVLRSRTARWGFRWIHPDIGAAVARRVSRTKPGTAGPPNAESTRAAELERWARGVLLGKDAPDVVLLGHTHVPTCVEVAPGRHYLNSGDWLHHNSYVVLPSGEAPYLARWEDGSEVTGVRVGSVTR
ncbi:MAG: UDP-2,3-diacylglucosamine diphosphatase [Gemmatimonadota bacterium]